MRVLQADLARHLGDDMGVQPVFAVAELDIDHPLHLGMRLHHLPHTRGELLVAGGHVLTGNDIRFHRLEVDIDARRLRQLGANRPLQCAARA